MAEREPLVFTSAAWAPLAEACDRIRTALGSWELAEKQLEHLLSSSELPAAVEYLGEFKPVEPSAWKDVPPSKVGDAFPHARFFVDRGVLGRLYPLSVRRERPPKVELEHTRWQLDAAIAGIKTLHPPDGIPTKRTTNEEMRKQLNRLPQFKDKPIRSKETVRQARVEIQAGLDQK
jgi:hypothetical protein